MLAVNYSLFQISITFSLAQLDSPFLEERLLHLALANSVSRQQYDWNLLQVEVHLGVDGAYLDIVALNF